MLASSATAAAAPVGAGKLSPRLAKLSIPALGAAGPKLQAKRLSLAPSGPGSLLRDGNRVLVDVRFDRGVGAGVAALRTAGAAIVEVSRARRTVTVAARPADLTALGALAGVGGVTEILTPILRGADCGGSVRSEGDAQLRAQAARSDFGVDGSGVTVGILSDSFNRDGGAVTHAAGDVAHGDLPGPGSPCGSTAPVGVFDDGEAEGEDEGRAMAQIVHDLAPGASIEFTSAFQGENAFAADIRALAAGGAGVIVDDVAYPEEPFFQDGPVAVAVNDVAAAGVSYFSAAGNDNVIAGGEDVASYEAPFRDAGSCPTGVPEAEGSACADFDPGPGIDSGYELSVKPGATVRLDLQWAEPWGGVKTDLDAYLLSSGGGVLDSAATNRNIDTTQRPFEFLAWKNEGPAATIVELAIPRFAGTESPGFKFIQFGNGEKGVSPTAGQLTSSGDVLGPTVFGHAGAAGAIALGAVSVGNGTEPEEYSSRGPVTHLFGPVVGSSAAPPIAAQSIAKPDLVASDCGVTTFFSFQDEFGAWRFCGTSAAAPHAAAVAALVRQVNPGASAAQVRADLTATAVPLGGFGPNEVGAGLIDARAAVDALALPPAITITKAPAALSQDRRPTVEFAANRPVAFSCSLDGATPQPCASPYQLPLALGDGRHGFVVSGTDLSGRTGGSGVVSFRVDTRAPRTSIAGHPRQLIRTHQRRAKVVFRFRSSEAGSTFVCKVDRELLRFCRPRFALRLGEGRHAVRVRARDEAGNVDSSAAVFHFRIKRLG